MANLRIFILEQEKSKKKSEKGKNLDAHKEMKYAENATSKEDEQFAREKLRELKKFYTDLLIYGVVCVCSIIVWLSMGAGTFWPIWVIIGCGIDVGLKAISLGQIPMLEEFFPFLSNTWEESQLEKIMNHSNEPSLKQKCTNADNELNQKSD